MNVEPTILVVSAGDPDERLIAALEQHGLYVERTGTDAFAGMFPLVAPDLVLCLGAPEARRVAALIDSAELAAPSRLAVLCSRGELPEMRRLPNSRVAAVLTTDSPPLLLAVRLVELTRSARGAEPASHRKATWRGIGAAPPAAASPTTSKGGATAPIVSAGSRLTSLRKFAKPVQESTQPAASAAPLGPHARQPAERSRWLRGGKARRAIVGDRNLTRALAIAAALTERGLDVLAVALDPSRTDWSQLQAHEPEVLLVDLESVEGPAKSWLQLFEADDELGDVRLVKLNFERVYDEVDEQVSLAALEPYIEELSSYRCEMPTIVADAERADFFPDDEQRHFPDDEQRTTHAGSEWSGRYSASSNPVVARGAGAAAHSVAERSAFVGFAEHDEDEMPTVARIDLSELVGPSTSPGTGPLRTPVPQRPPSSLPPQPVSVAFPPVGPHAQRLAQRSLSPSATPAPHQVPSPVQAGSSSKELAKGPFLGSSPPSASLVARKNSTATFPGWGPSSPPAAPASVTTPPEHPVPTSPFGSAPPAPRGTPRDVWAESAARNLAQAPGQAPAVEPPGRAFAESAAEPLVAPLAAAQFGQVAPPGARISAPPEVTGSAKPLGSRPPAPITQNGTVSSGVGPSSIPIELRRNAGLPGSFKVILGLFPAAALALLAACWLAPEKLPAELHAWLSSGDHAQKVPESQRPSSPPSLPHAPEPPKPQAPAPQAFAAWVLPPQQTPTCEQLVEAPSMIDGASIERGSAAWERARRLLVLGDMGAAHKHMCAAVLNNPQSLALEGLISYYLSLHAAEQAHKWSEVALDVRPDSRNAGELHGDALSQLGREQEARDAWLAALSLARGDQKVASRVAESYVGEAEKSLLSKDIPRAESMARRAAGLDPHSAAASALMASVFVALGEDEHARYWLKRCQEQNAEEPACLLVRGDFELEEGRSADAAATYRRVTQLAPGNRRGWQRLGRVPH